MHQVFSIPANSGYLFCGYFVRTSLLAFLYNDSFAIPCIFTMGTNKISCLEGVEDAKLQLICCDFVGTFVVLVAPDCLILLFIAGRVVRSWRSIKIVAGAGSSLGNGLAWGASNAKYGSSLLLNAFLRVFLTA